MNRGSKVRPVRAVRLPMGFNEAPIHESGKCRTYTPWATGDVCFNEAPIHESGK